MAIDISALNTGERFVFEWQYGMQGDFKAALVVAILKADTMNKARLARAFPDEVQAVVAYQTIDGWWQAVEEKARA
jgi:hypothetical protein